MTDIELQYERICNVLSIFYSNPEFFPRGQDFEDLNPTKDPGRRRIHKIESAWDWRDRVYRALRTQDEIYSWEKLFGWRYLNNSESHAFWVFYNDGIWKEVTKKAIKKVHMNFERMGIYWE